MDGTMLEGCLFSDEDLKDLDERLKMIKDYAELYGDGTGLTMTDEDVLISWRKVLKMHHAQIMQTAKTFTDTE